MGLKGLIVALASSLRARPEDAYEQEAEALRQQYAAKTAAANQRMAPTQLSPAAIAGQVAVGATALQQQAQLYQNAHAQRVAAINAQAAQAYQQSMSPYQNGGSGNGGYGQMQQAALQNTQPRYFATGVGGSAWGVVTSSAVMPGFRAQQAYYDPGWLKQYHEEREKASRERMVEET